MGQSLLQADPTSKSVLEIQLTNVDQPDDDAAQGTMWDQVVEGENALEVSGEEIPSLELADQIAVCKHIPVTEPNSLSVNTSSTSMTTSAQQLQCEMEESESEHGDIMQDAQLFQDAALEYQIAYQSLEDKYTHQAVLMKEASEALQVSKSHVSAMQEELMALKCNCKADIQRAVSNVVSQYQHQLSSAQSHTRDHQSVIMQLQEQVQVLQVSLASQRDLPSGVHPKGRWISGRKCLTSSQRQSIQIEVPLCIIHPTISISETGPIWDWPNPPDLESDTVGGQGPQLASSHVPPYASTPFCGSSQVPLNHTFDISRIPASNTGNAQEAATIVAEVLAAAVAQASKEFWHMQEPKIT